MASVATTLRSGSAEVPLVQQLLDRFLNEAPPTVVESWTVNGRRLVG